MVNKNSFKKGTIELLLLSLLNTEDCYGYQMTQKIKQQSEGLITVTEGALYPILYRLVEQGYVTDYQKPAGKRLMRRYYHLEEDGITYFHSLLDDYHKVQSGVHKILSINLKEPEISQENE
ncbi:MAG: PadR family transcriptional regulator [Anaerostipes sp.]|nr:PadR family transcriptional regulator [Anaerostipes sp.]